MAKDPAQEPELGRIIESAKRQLERMIDLSPTIMLLVDTQGRIRRTNRALLDYVGLPDFPSALGRPLAGILHADAALDAFLDGPGEGVRIHECACEIPGRGGRDLRLTAVGGGGEEVRAVMIEDITEVKRQAAVAEKEHKRAAVEALAGALKHRINQALTVITVRAKLMLVALEKGETRPAEMRRSLEDITALAMQISDVLQRAEKPRDFLTETYLDDLEILDIEGSAGRDDAAPEA
ncbi:MAG: hypothetical protein JW951_04605 [Lentisphaerae bacterium]|nr:hypothetical protein [Lentisphaerota bacterium]